MNCKDVIDIIEKHYPVSYALEWDNVGLLAGCAGQKVRKVYVAVDLTDECIEEAAAAHADMIVTHHPLIFSPLHTVTDSDFTGKRIIRLIENHICCYAMHTNYDVLRMADLAADRMGLKNCGVLDLCYPDEGKGIGKTGELPQAMTLEDCCKLVKERFNLEHVKVFGDMQSVVRKAAILPGSGKSDIDTAVKKNADVFITGDIGHHEGIDAVAKGISVIDAGHYGIEHIFIEDMKKFFETNIPQIETEAAKIKHPFSIC